MIVAIIPLIVAILSLIVYFASDKNPKVQNITMWMFVTSWLVIMEVSAHRTVHFP